MARKQKQDELFSIAPFASEELDIYLDTASDFAFELRCFANVKSLGFQCTHGGSYIDRVSGKPRQFDIRAQGMRDKRQVRCAIECKNISPTYPALICCTPREADEADHELLMSWRHGANPRRKQGDRRPCEALHAGASRYRALAPVGKDIKRIARTPEPAIYSAVGGDVYDAWSQALSSAEGLVKEAAHDGMTYGAHTLSLILPIVVVPNGALWKVEFDGNGKHDEPVLTNRCPFFVGHKCDTTDGEIALTHIEFVTLAGLCEMLVNLFAGDGIYWSPESYVPWTHDTYGDDDK